MLCRVLFVAAVVSYVLCVLLLSGVQKEELDEGTLRKLQRHNVNIDAIGDRKLRSQCLTEKDLATTLSTPRVNTGVEAEKSIMKPITFELDAQNAGSPSKWNKLFAYFKQNKLNSSKLKETTMQSIVLPSNGNMDTLPSPMQSHFIEEIIAKVAKIPENIVKNNEKEKAQYVFNNTDTIQLKSSTSKDTIAERSNDVDYINKIVAEILSQRQPNQGPTSTVLPMRNFNANKLVEDIDKILRENKINATLFRTNYSLNNTAVTEKQESSPDKDEKEMIEGVLNQLRNPDIQPINNLRERFLNNIPTEFEESKITLNNARDELSDMLNITKNEPNNWLYVVDSQGIKPITSESLADKEEVFNQLSERDKVILCKSNNEMHNLCPYSESSKPSGSMPKEQNNLHFDSPSERDKTSYSKSVNEHYPYPNDNKSILPYYIENQNNVKNQKIKMEHSNLDIQLPSDRYEPKKAHDLIVNDEYNSKWPYYLQRQMNTEQQDLNRENTNLLLVQLNNREKITNGINEIDRNNNKNFENPLYPLGFANHPEGDNHYKTEWAYNIKSAKQFEPEVETKHENPIFIRPRADKKITDSNNPTVNGEFKNTWPYFEDIRITQNPNLLDKSALYRIPPDREMFLNEHERMLLDKESSINSRLDKREKTSNSRDRIDPKSYNWYEMEGHDIKDKKATGTSDNNVKSEQKSTIRDETTRTKNDMSPITYDTINWPYFIERQKAQHDPLYITNSKIPKGNEYYLVQKGEAYNKLLTNAEARSNLYQTHLAKDDSKNELKKDDKDKFKSLPPDVLKQIADTVKEIILKDLKTETPVISIAKTTIITTAPITATTMEPTTTAITTSTATSNTAVPITVKTAAEPKTTTDTKSTSGKDDHMKIEEASQALKNFMELFEKFNQMKNGNLNFNITQTPDNITQTQRGGVIATIPTMVRNPYAAYKIATVPTLVRNPYSTYKFNAPLLPPMSTYGIQSPYLQTKAMALDPYLQKIIQIPATTHNNAVDNVRSVGRSAHALTVQTNSNEIKPLNIPVSKDMIVDNIVLSPKPPRDIGRHLQDYSDETYRHRKPGRYTQRNKYNVRSNRSRDYFNVEDRPKPRSVKKEYSYKDRYYKPRLNYQGVRFHEKLEKEDGWPSSVEGKCGSKEICNERVASRQQRPLVNIASTYDDTHFRNFLKTQQKVNDMLERILATKTKHNRRSSEVI